MLWKENKRVFRSYKIELKVPSNHVSILLPPFPIPIEGRLKVEGVFEFIGWRILSLPYSSFPSL